MGAVTCETDRARFVGRGRSTRDPARAGRTDGALSGTTGAVLDPIFALRARVRLRPGQVRDGRVHDARRRPRASRRSSSPIDTTTRTRRSARSISPGPPRRWSCASSTSRRPTRRSSRSWPATSSSPTPRSARRPGRSPAQSRLAAAALGARRLGRLADRARDDRLGGRTADAAAAPRGAPLLAAPRHDGGSRRPECAPHQLPAGAARPDRRGGVRSKEAGRSTIPAACSFAGATSLDADGLLMLRATARVHVPCEARSLGRIAGGGREATAARTPPRRISRAANRLRFHRACWERTDHRASHPASRRRSRPIDAQRSGQRLRRARTRRRLRDPRRGDAVPPAPWANVIANPRAGFIVSERGARIHLGRQQLLPPPHAVAQRSGQ